MNVYGTLFCVFIGGEESLTVGRSAVDETIRKIDGVSDTYPTIKLLPELVVRESTARRNHT